MIILVNDNQMDKKVFKGIQRFIISEDVSAEKKKDIVLKSFIPETNLYNMYLNGQISEKKFAKKYIKTIEASDDAYSIVLMILSTVLQKKNVLFVCSKDEMDMGYMQILLQYISDRFGVKIASYKKWSDKKKLDTKISKDFNGEVFLEELDNYKEFLFNNLKEFEDARKAFGKALGVKIKHKKISKKKKHKINKNMVDNMMEKDFTEDMSIRIFRAKVK